MQLASGNPSARIDVSFLAEIQMPEKVEQKAEKQLLIETPKLDLVPEAVFKAMFGRTVQQAGLPLIVIPRASSDLPPLTGVLVYATTFNVPLGCFRISSNEVFSCVVGPEPAKHHICGIVCGSEMSVSA